MKKVLTSLLLAALVFSATAQEAAKEEKKSREEVLKTGKNSRKTVAAQQYTQRDYDGEQEDAMRRMLSGVRNGGDSHA